jgi:hypothetical protein
MPERKNLPRMNGKLLKPGNSQPEVVFFILRPLADIYELGNRNTFAVRASLLNSFLRILWKLKSNHAHQVFELDKKYPETNFP